MQIESVFKNGYQILRVKDDLNFTSNLSDIKWLVEEYLRQGIVNIAISISAKSYLSSMSIGYLLHCYKMLKEQGGRLAVIQPDSEDTDLLEVLSLTSVIETYTSEEELNNKSVSLE